MKRQTRRGPQVRPRTSGSSSQRKSVSRGRLRPSATLAGLAHSSDAMASFDMPGKSAAPRNFMSASAGFLHTKPKRRQPQSREPSLASGSQSLAASLSLPEPQPRRAVLPPPATPSHDFLKARSGKLASGLARTPRSPADDASVDIESLQHEPYLQALFLKVGRVLQYRACSPLASSLLLPGQSHLLNSGYTMELQQPQEPTPQPESVSNWVRYDKRARAAEASHLYVPHATSTRASFTLLAFAARHLAARRVIVNQPPLPAAMTNEKVPPCGLVG